MWICDKCGRRFENTDQDHICEGREKTVDAYIDLQPDSVRPVLQEIREAIRSALPDAEERISWSMPTFWKKSNIIHFAAHKKHVGIYPGDKAIEHFSDRLKPYKSSKGAVQFPYHQEIPLALIQDIAQWCYNTGNHH